MERLKLVLANMQKFTKEEQNKLLKNAFVRLSC